MGCFIDLFNQRFGGEDYAVRRQLEDHDAIYRKV